MAGYSGTPLAKKLGIKPRSRIALVGAPAGFGPELAPLPEGVGLSRRLGPNLDLAMLFVRYRRDLERRFPLAGAKIHSSGALWIAWPKRSSGVDTDLTENILRQVLLPSGWVDTKVCAVTDIWSGLRFVRRLEYRSTS